MPFPFRSRQSKIQPSKPRLQRSPGFQYRSHSFEQAVASPYKYAVYAHGSLLSRTFRVPRNITLVFLTYPGACARGAITAAATKSDADARAAMQRRHKDVLHSVTYMPGDMVQDVGLSFHQTIDMIDQTRDPKKGLRIKKVKTTEGLGIFRIGRAERRYYDLPSNLPVPRLETSLQKVVDMMSRRPEKPIVLLVASCRVAHKNSNHDSCMGLDKLACQKQYPKRTSVPSHITSRYTADHAVQRHFDKKFWGGTTW